MSGEQAGHEKNCFKCNTPIIYVAVGGNLQWQNKADGKAHYTYISDKNYKCNLPEAKPTEAKPTEAAPQNKTITPNGPFEEAELIARWARERAYKITMAEVTDINNLSVQEKSALGQSQGMLTRLLADTTIELMKIHGTKTKYPGEE